MKALLSFFRLGILVCPFVCVFFSPLDSSAQTGGGGPPDLSQPTVTIQATDSQASEPGVLTAIDPAVLTLYRHGNTNVTLDIHLQMSGTASNGADYTTISNHVIIPAGETSKRITVNPLLDNFAEGTETVVVRVLDPVCIAIYPPPPECYKVGTPYHASVYITDRGETNNQPPTVYIVTPTNGASFIALTNIQICADARDADGYADYVEFFAGNLRLGARTNCLPCASIQNPFCFLWTNVPPGSHVLSARVTDNLGARTTSAPVHITVGPLLTNAPPVVTIATSDAIASEGTNCCRWNNWSNSPTAAFCGTNTARFVIQRSGPTNNALTVHYRIAGTASNGVDYAALPGSATIPSGKRAVEIKLIPLDDAVSERLETVVLGLHAPPDVSSNAPPYVIGFPSRAAAVIVDNDAPRPITCVLADRCFHIMKPGANGSWWRIECSANAIDWTVLGTNVVTDGALHFVDPDAVEASSRFYRAVPCEAPPPD